MDLLIEECQKAKPDFKVVKTLINNEGVDITRALHIAISKNHTKIARFLIENGADVNSNIMDGYDNRSVLFDAIAYNNENLVRALIDNGADVNICTDEDNYTPLIWAAHLGKRDNIVKMLVKAGADVNVQDAGNFTPFMWAMLHGDKNIARFLFNNGADTMKRCYSNLTAFDWAKKEGHSSVF
jgi:ankyrin repeat protein